MRQALRIFGIFCTDHRFLQYEIVCPYDSYFCVSIQLLYATFFALFSALRKNLLAPDPMGNARKT
jgi:hypothetical protein